MENQDTTEDVGEIEYTTRSHFDRSVLPTAPKAARGPDVDMERIPQNPPFTAFIGNLAYEASEEKIEDFFKKLKVVNVRLPTDQGRLRGFGYVEFEDRESLIEALTLNDSIFVGRKIRVDLAGHNQQGGERSNSDNRRSDEPDRTQSDWRRRDPGMERVPDRSGNDRGFDRDGGRGYGNRDGGRFSDRYGDRDGGSRYGDRDGGRYGDRDGGRYGDRDGSRYGDRDGGRYGDRDGGRYGDRDGGRYGDRDGGRYGDRDGGRYGDRDGGRYGDRNNDRYGDRYGDRNNDRYGDSGRYSDRYGDRDGDRYGRGGRGYSDRDGGRRGYGSGFRQGDSDSYDRPNSRETSQDAPKERPKLQLQPRTKPVEKDPSVEERKSSIFGAAKPVDTSAREREIEERLQREKQLTSTRFDEEKENRNFDNRREMSTGSRQRRDSDRSDGGSKRERRLSSSSGKGVRPGPPPVTTQRSRKDSELSNHSDVFNEDKEDSKTLTSPKREDTNTRMVDAPPPKENAWSKRPPSHSSPGSQSSEPRSPPVVSSPPPSSSAWSKGRPSENAWGKRDRDGSENYKGPSDRGRGRGRGVGRGSDRGRGSDKKPVREKHIPQSIEEMPKYEEKVQKDWADTNKYSFLMGGDGN